MGIAFRIVQRGLVKKPHVEFDCPTCKTTLYALLLDAGKSDTCPECETVFVTPGAKALRAQQDAEQAEADHKEAERARELEARTKAIEREAEARLEQSLAAQRRAAVIAERLTYRPGAWLGVVGWALLVLGLLGCVVGAVADTTAPGSDVHNLGLMHDRSLLVVTGALALLFGLVLIGLDIAMAELDRIRRSLEKPADAPK